MGSDHAPIMCILGLNNSFRVDIKHLEPKFNFTKADRNTFGLTMDSMINQNDTE